MATVTVEHLVPPPKPEDIKIQVTNPIRDTYIPFAVLGAVIAAPDYTGSLRTIDDLATQLLGLMLDLREA